MKTGIAELPLHYGSTPRWLFEKMKNLAKLIAISIIDNYSAKEFLRRVSDVFWFQAFACVLGFDWHSSGSTTTVTAALKEGIKDIQDELGVFICGGKGKRARKTPEEIHSICSHLNIEPQELIYSSKLTAKIDNSALQDGYQIYHHTFLFLKDKSWAVIQQGMNPLNSSARRYHWLSEELKDFVSDPHKAICCDYKTKALNLVASECKSLRKNIIELTNYPNQLINDMKKISHLKLPENHEIRNHLTFSSISRLNSTIYKIYENSPKDFESLLVIEGVGPKTLRALALISHLIYGNEISWRDPVKYSFAHGGKDSHPYPINKKEYELSISILKDAIEKSKMNDKEKILAIKKLSICQN